MDQFPFQDFLLDKQGDSGEFEHSNGDDSDDDGLRISPGTSPITYDTFRTTGFTHQSGIDENKV